MDLLLFLIMSLPAWILPKLPIEERPFHPFSVVPSRSKNDSDEWLNRAIERQATERELWYGTPGVRAGEDMLAPILDLLKHPSGLLDFSPRKIPSYVDPKLEEFNRRYQESKSAHRSQAGPIQPATEK